MKKVKKVMNLEIVSLRFEGLKLVSIQICAYRELYCNPMALFGWSIETYDDKNYHRMTILWQLII